MKNAQTPDRPQESDIRTLDVEESDSGQRLDRFLVSKLPELTRVRIQALIRDGHVTTTGKSQLTASNKVKPGDVYHVRIPPAVSSEPAAEHIELSVVFEDAHLIVIDKPAGLVVHPAAGHASGTLVNALIAHCGPSLSGIGGVKRPGIVHRLDKDTSGLLVVAKTDKAHLGLSEIFAAHGQDGRLHRTYRALIWGAPPRPSGRIEARLARSKTNRKKISVVKGEAGRHAVTHYEVLEKFGGTNAQPRASLLRLKLETGRTHQIRVHLAHIGHPVMADPTYGAHFKASANKLSKEARDALKALGRQALHAAELGFEHPVAGKMLFFRSPLPNDIERLRQALGAERTAY